MVYTLNGPGPLRGLPSLRLSDVELEGMESLDAFARAAEKFGLSDGKRFVILDVTRAKDIALRLRALKTRGFVIYGVTDGNTEFSPIGFDSVIVMNAGEPWLGFTCAAYVYGVLPGAEMVTEIPLLPRALSGVPKYLDVAIVNRDVLRFLSDSQYPWAVQLRDSFTDVRA